MPIRDWTTAPHTMSAAQRAGSSRPTACSIRSVDATARRDRSTCIVARSPASSLPRDSNVIVEQGICARWGRRNSMHLRRCRRSSACSSTWTTTNPVTGRCDTASTRSPRRSSPLACQCTFDSPMRRLAIVVRNSATSLSSHSTAASRYAPGSRSGRDPLSSTHPVSTRIPSPGQGSSEETPVGIESPSAIRPPMCFLAVNTRKGVAATRCTAVSTSAWPASNSCASSRSSP